MTKPVSSWIALAHNYGLRVVPYVRGNEISVREDGASGSILISQRISTGSTWITAGLLAMLLLETKISPAAGSPSANIIKPCVPCGTVSERMVSSTVIQVPVIRGIASSFFDGYVSGEGERGILIKGRTEHEYFTMSAISPGSMWTAAFPEYSSKCMTPFLAAAAQPPHIPIGKQIESSSLRHPPVPGISDNAFRKLLYIWSLLDCGERAVWNFTQTTIHEVFCKRDPVETAHCLIMASDGKYGVMTLSNCSGSEKNMKASFKLNGKFSKYKIYAIPGEKAPPEVKELAPYEVIGAIIAQDSITAKKVLEKNPHQEMKQGQEVKKYLRLLEYQKNLRTPAGASKKNDLVIFVPTRVTSHERSLMNALYDVAFELRERLADGKVKRFGWISKKGLVKFVPSDDERLHPGEYSNVIDLSKILKKGTHTVEVYSTYKGEPFYSFAVADFVSDSKKGRIEFMNELERDRAILHWTISVKEYVVIT